MQRIGFEFDPFELAGLAPPKGKEAEARAEIARYVTATVIEKCGDAQSSVAGGKWKRSLSKEYKARKVAEGGNPYADMILSGDMLSALDCVVKRDGILDLRVTGADNVAKADGHNNFSGKSSLPLRQFLPEEGGNFRRDIVQGIREIIRSFGD